MSPTPSAPSTRQVPMVGRYEVAGRIATGGMAEVFLGRLAGPSGFERAVALKRILPHLADETSFVDMFVDEARIAARIRHPNVVQVHELGKDDGEFFLAMEYLEGETLAGLCRRLTARGRTLPADLAAYIVSEAAAGLHAAHELRDDEGALVELVHRDVSPQNLFVGYCGNIKVLDFGVAKAAGRLTHTGHGELKGKLCYMSPEQIENATLDRRSDVFALGVVLYELVAGRRLFRRTSAGATVRAIVQGEMPPLGTFVDDIDPDLETACLNALVVDRDGRTPTAAQLRRELSLIVAHHSDRGLPEERLAELMEELFAERANEKREMLRRMRAGSNIASVPAGEVDVSVEVPTIPYEATPRDPDAVGEPIARGRRRALGAIGVLAVAAVGLAGLWRSGQGSTAPVAVRPEPSAAGLQTSPRPEPRAAVEGPAASSVGRRSEPTDLVARRTHLPVEDDTASEELREAVTLLYRNRLSECEAALTSLVTADPSDGAAHYYRALRRGFGAVPAEALHEALLGARGCSQPPSRSAMLDVLEAFGQDDHEGAAQIARATLELDPGNWELRYGLGEALFHSGDLAGGIRELNRSNDLAPPFLIPYLHVVEYAIAHGDGTHLPRWFDALESVEETRSTGRSYRARWLIATGDARGALRVPGEHTPPRFLAHLVLGEFDAARAVASSRPQLLGGRRTLPNAPFFAQIAHARGRGDEWQRWMSMWREQSEAGIAENRGWQDGVQCTVYLMVDEVEQARASARALRDRDGTQAGERFCATVLAWRERRLEDLPVVTPTTPRSIGTLGEAVRESLAGRAERAAELAARALDEVTNTNQVDSIAWFSARLAREAGAEMWERACGRIQWPRSGQPTWVYARAVCAER